MHPPAFWENHVHHHGRHAGRAPVGAGREEPSTAELVKDAEDLLQEGASHEVPGRRSSDRGAGGRPSRETKTQLAECHWYPKQPEARVMEDTWRVENWQGTGSESHQCSKGSKGPWPRRLKRAMVRALGGRASGVRLRASSGLQRCETFRPHWVRYTCPFRHGSNQGKTTESPMGEPHLDPSGTAPDSAALRHSRRHNVGVFGP